MSLGWVFCSECERYRKWEEYGDYDNLSCDHKHSEAACVSDLAPDYDWGRGYSPDDKFAEDKAAGIIAEYELAWKNYHYSKTTVEKCQCGRYHILGVTFNVD